MKNKIQKMWREKKLLFIGFILVSLFTAMLLTRTIIGAVYFKNHADLPILPWMPIAFIAKTYHVPPDILLQSVGIPTDGSIHQRMRNIASETGVSHEELIQQMMDAIAQHRTMSPRP